MSRIIRLHQCISGFTQRGNRIHGVFKLCEALHEAGHNNHVSRVSLRPWNDDWAAAAENAWLLGEHHNAELQVQIYAYSWGGGWGAPEFCRELLDRGVNVRRVILSDPVYRHPNPILRWTSMIQRNSRLAPVIRFPRNVDQIHSFHQTRNTPQGHLVEGDKDFTGHIVPSVRCDMAHQYMDDAKRFRRLCLDQAELWRVATS